MDANIYEAVSTYLSKQEVLSQNNLGTRMDRYGTGGARIISANVENWNGSLKKGLVVGEPVKFIFDFEGPASNLSCVFTIYRITSYNVCYTKLLRANGGA